MDRMGWIVVRDVPKVKAQIDLWTFGIQGGFRGFQLVPPGAHYVNVLAGHRHPGFWCAVQPGQVVVRVLDAEQLEFRQDEEETEAEFAALAAGGAMSQALAIYPNSGWFTWRQLTRHMSAGEVPPRLHRETPDPLPIPPLAPGSRLPRTRLELALHVSHGGSVQGLLAELEFAFLRWLLAKEGNDQEALDRWTHLLLACYNAGEFSIAATPELFSSLVDTLLAQFAYLPNSWFAPGTAVTTQAGYLAEDLIDVGLLGLAEQGHKFAAYVKRRTAGPEAANRGG